MKTATVKPSAFADLRRGSRHARGYGSAWDKTRLRILRRDGGICQPCRADGVVHAGNEVDHILPKASGGSDDDANLQTICKARHAAKTAIEALAARGITERRPAQACATTGMPADPAHPWNQQGRGTRISAPSRAGTDPEQTLARPRYG